MSWHDELIGETHESIKDEQDKVIEDFALVMKKPEGRRVIGWLLDKSRVDQSSFVGDKEWTVFYEGARAVGLSVMQLLKRPELEKQYLIFLQERAKDEHRRFREQNA